MNFLLDTNVVSEWVKPRPDPGVTTWLAEVDEDRVFLSVITLAELRHGIQRMPQGIRRNRLNTWLAEELRDRFEQRVLTIDASTADAWGIVMARGQAWPVDRHDGWLSGRDRVKARSDAGDTKRY